MRWKMLQPRTPSSCFSCPVSSVDATARKSCFSNSLRGTTWETWSPVLGFRGQNEWTAVFVEAAGSGPNRVPSADSGRRRGPAAIDTNLRAGHSVDLTIYPIFFVMIHSESNSIINRVVSIIRLN